MKSKFIKYLFTVLAIIGGFWFYFQIDTYPYKVDRWFQPMEAKIISATAKNCSPDTSWLNLFVNHAVTHQGAYSAQVAFLSVENRLSHCEIGYQHKIGADKLSKDHRFRYASISKLVTTAIIINLAREGQISLSDTLLKFLPEVTQLKDERIRHITIADLLNHKAGFNRHTLAGDPMFLRRNKPWCPSNLKELQTFKLAFTPGEKQIYSNIGYCLLGEIIHRVTDESYRDYVERKFSLSGRSIKFIDNYYYNDEVRYDFRYEEWYNNSYLKLFDFEAISSAAGLSGSATALAHLLWDIHHNNSDSPFSLRLPAVDCNLSKIGGCLTLGVNHYRPEKHGITLHYHKGYLPGSTSFAVIDSFGGVTVLTQSGASRYQENPQNEWIEWAYQRLSLYYILQGKLSILDSQTKIAD